MNDDVLTRVSGALRAAAEVLAMAYDPDDPEDRLELANKLAKKLGEIGFKESAVRSRDPGRYYRGGYKGKELVLTFHHRKDPGLTINVYTSISSDSGSVRSKGADAIRICTEYHTKAHRAGEDGGFIATNLVFKRTLEKNEIANCIVQRRGSSIDAIVDRVVERARSAYRALNVVKRCRKCSAPMALSKKGKEYCAETCWMK